MSSSSDEPPSGDDPKSDRSPAARMPAPVRVAAPAPEPPAPEPAPAPVASPEPVTEPIKAVADEPPAPAPEVFAPVAPPVENRPEPPIVARRLGAENTPPPEAPRTRIKPRRERASPAPQAELAPADGTADQHSMSAPPPSPAAPARKKPEGRPAGRRPLLREFVNLGVSLSFIGAIAGLAVLFLVVAPWPDEQADLWALNRTQAIVILDRNGREIAARGARYGEAVAVGELPPVLVKAFLATEDRRFYDHGGIDLKGVARAVAVNIRSGGKRTEGASTITQQLARNLFLSAEQTYSRKAKEAMLALWLEGRYSKDEILSLYLNRIYFGAGAYGVESAARTYFGKSARDVSLSEAALLAGLPQAPSTLAPTQNPLGAQDRAFEVIGNLRETGDITEFDAREARRRPPVIAAGSNDNGVGWFFDYVAEKARVLAGDGALDIVVRTTLDQKLQRDAETAVTTGLDVDAKTAGAVEGALIAYENDGAIRAMVGGRNYLQSQFNRATQARRQPGSAFKPIVYAAAFENGVTPQSRFVDQPIDIAGWKPTNYDQKYHGSMRLTEAVAKSINTIAVQVSEQIGRQKVIAMARRLGLSSDIPTGEAGIALGGFPATLDELTAAYIPFAIGGAGVRPYAITEIADGRGKVLYRRNDRTPAPVMEKKIARDVTHVLYQVVTSGTGRAANLQTRQAAGKTGTTNDYRDAWFIGYTAQMTAGVWVGNDNFQPMAKVTGGAAPARIWKNFMTAAHADLPAKPLDGAYAEIAYSEQGRLLSFYRDLSSALRRVMRDGDEERGFDQ